MIPDDRYVLGSPTRAALPDKSSNASEKIVEWRVSHQQRLKRCETTVVLRTCGPTAAASDVEGDG